MSNNLFSRPDDGLALWNDTTLLHFECESLVGIFEEGYMTFHDPDERFFGLHDHKDEIDTDDLSIPLRTVPLTHSIRETSIFSKCSILLPAHSGSLCDNLDDKLPQTSSISTLFSSSDDLYSKFIVSQDEAEHPTWMIDGSIINSSELVSDLGVCPTLVSRLFERSLFPSPSVERQLTLQVLESADSIHQFFVSCLPDSTTPSSSTQELGAHLRIKEEETESPCLSPLETADNAKLQGRGRCQSQENDCQCTSQYIDDQPKCTTTVKFEVKFEEDGEINAEIPLPIILPPASPLIDHMLTPILDAHKGVDLEILRDRLERYRTLYPHLIGRQWWLDYVGKLSAGGERLDHFRCYVDGCQQTNRRRDHAVVHIGTHVNHRPFECPQCGMQFFRKNECRRHQLGHSDTKLFVCEHCPLASAKAFNRMDHLNRHIDNAHKGKRKSRDKENQIPKMKRARKAYELYE